MIKILFYILTLAIILEARENPFFPADGEMDIPLTSNLSTKIPALKRATISLPPQARVIQKVTVEYKNLDGSIETKSVTINNAVDWHLPIFISQNYNISTSIDGTAHHSFKMTGTDGVVYETKATSLIVGADTKIKADSNGNPSIFTTLTNIIKNTFKYKKRNTYQSTTPHHSANKACKNPHKEYGYKLNNFHEYNSIFS